MASTRSSFSQFDHPARRPWRAYAQGSLAMRARATADAIAHDLIAGPAPDLPLDLEPQRRAALAASLASGAAGEAIFLFAHARDAAERDAAHAAASQQAAHARLGKAVRAVGELPMDATLFAGFPGVAWVVAHTKAGAEESLEAIDEILSRHVAARSWSGEFDLAGGLVGIGLYAIERLPDPGGRRLLEGVLAALAATAESVPPGVAWRSSDGMRRRVPGSPALGPWNLGMAHGTPGVVAFLALATLATQAHDSAALLDDGLRWLLAQRMEASAGGAYPCSVGPGSDSSPSRLAWCYGDAGIAVALGLAARARAEPSSSQEARAVTRLASARAVEASGVRDAGLCHGAGGVAHACARLGGMWADATLLVRAADWLDVALSMREPGRGVGGYRALRTEPSGETRWSDDPSLLTGAAGVGLACLAAVSDREPAWDRMLALSDRGAELS